MVGEVVVGVDVGVDVAGANVGVDVGAVVDGADVGVDVVGDSEKHL